MSVEHTTIERIVRERDTAVIALGDTRHLLTSIVDTLSANPPQTSAALAYAVHAQRKVTAALGVVRAS